MGGHQFDATSNHSFHGPSLEFTLNFRGQHFVASVYPGADRQHAKR